MELDVIFAIERNPNRMGKISNANGRDAKFKAVTNYVVAECQIQHHKVNADKVKEIAFMFIRRYRNKINWQ